MQTFAFKNYLKTLSLPFLLLLVFSLSTYAYLNKVNVLHIAFAEASDYYVATTGSDTNDGSQIHPFLTIQKAADTTVAGDTVHVLLGTYAPFTINNSGTAAAPITYISDTRWQASIFGTGDGKTKSYLIRNNANYIHIIGFDMQGQGITDGVDNFGAYNLVQGNHIHKMTNITCSGSPGGAALGDDAGSNNTYDSNMVDHIGDYPTKCDYVHAIYVDDTGDIVSNNITYDNVGNGLYTNHGTGSVTFINNLSFANLEYGVGINGSASGNIVANNILIGNGIAGIKTWSGTSNTQISNNILYNNASNYLLNGSAIQSGNLVTDPKLINYQADGSGDYHLTSTSPAIDAGISTGAPMIDYDGNIRPQGLTYDIGAYEYVFPVTPTPSITTTPTPTTIISNTPTPSLTETPTATPVLTNSPTPTVSDTPTVTPTITDSPTPTATMTPTPTNTPSVTPTNSPTPTPTSVPANITVDSTSSLVQATNSTTITWNHTVGVQNNRLLMAQIVTYDPTYDVTAVTYNGVPLTQLSETPCGGTTSCRNEVWYLVNPVSGTHAITATTSHSARLTGAGISFYNVDQSNSFGTAAITTGHTTSSSVTALTNSTQYAIDFYGNQAYSTFTPKPGAGQTQLVNAGQKSVEDIAISTKTPGVSSTTFTWSWSSINGYADIAVGINPSSAVNPTSTPTPTFTVTPTPTTTPTNTPTPTFTITPTVTSTITPTPSPTDTPTPTFTVTPTPTVTPTVTPTNMPTSMPTITPTNSPTPIPTATPTPTPTITVAPTPTVTPTPTPLINSIGQDTFSRPDQTFWGTASDGNVWTADANTMSQFSIQNGTGKIYNSVNGGINYNAILGNNVSNAEIIFSGSISTFSSSNLGGVLRWTDSNNWYKVYIDGSNLYIQKGVNGSKTTIANVSFSATPNTDYTIRCRANGTTLSAKVWQTGTIEPTNWMINTTDATFSSGYTGMRTLLKSGETATYTSFQATSL